MGGSEIGNAGWWRGEEGEVLEELEGDEVGEVADELYAEEQGIRKARTGEMEGRGGEGRTSRSVMYQVGDAESDLGS